MGALRERERAMGGAVDVEVAVAGGGEKGRKVPRLIESVSNRQVTFSKRRTGLLKKAYELSVLCDAQVAVLVFSSTGRLSEFAAPSMSSVLEKYHGAIGMTQGIGHPLQSLEFWKHEAVLLKKQIDFLQLQESYLMGENLTHFQLKDLEILESKLCNAINKIKDKKMECFQLYAQEMSKKEHLLLQENTMLRLKIAGLESKRHRTESLEPSSQSVSRGANLTRQQCGLKEFNVTLELGLNPRCASS